MARQRGDNHIKCVRRFAAVRGGVCERVDNLHLLDDGAGPAVCDNDG